MRTFEIMVEDAERVVVTKNVEIEVVEEYTPDEDFPVQGGYSLVQITTDNPNCILKVTENNEVYKMSDCIEEWHSSNNGKLVHGSSFWEQVIPTIREQLLILGMKIDELDNHCSDLYIKKNGLSDAFVQTLKTKGFYGISTFTDNIDGELWYDIPFAYSEYLEERGAL